MKRILLALLALMTGLIAQAGPVQARINGNAETEIGMSENVRGGIHAAAAQTQAIAGPVTQKDRRQRQAARIRPNRGEVFIPSVLFGPDRALE